MFKKNKKWIVVVLTIVIAMFVFAGCGGKDAPAATPGGDTPATTTPAAPAGDAPATIKIGIPNPTTGPLAGFGIGTPWAEKLVEKAVNDAGGIYIEEYDTSIPIECIFVDTQSDPTIAAEVAQQLITKDGVNMLIARHTPLTALPVSAMAEANQVPCVSLECPVEPWSAGGPYEWVCHSFWLIEDNCDMFMDMWEALGYGEGTVVGGIFPNEPDGLAWEEIFMRKLPERGFKLVHPGLTEMMQDDFTNVISLFKAEGVQIVTGVPITPDFATFTTQAAQQGFKYDLMQMGRAYLFPSDAEAVGPLSEGLLNEVWWSPWHPWVSPLTGIDCQQLADMYESEFNIPWSAPMGYKYAGMEIAVDTLKRAASLDPVKIRDAMRETDLMTLVGPINYELFQFRDIPASYVSLTPIVGGQWTWNKDSETAEIFIVWNKPFPSVPINGSLRVPNR